MTAPALRPLATGIAAVAMLLGSAACSSDGGVAKADFEEYLRNGDIGEAQASCVTDRLFDQLDEDQITAGYETAAGEDLPAEVAEAIDTAAAACADEG